MGCPQPRGSRERVGLISSVSSIRPREPRWLVKYHWLCLWGCLRRNYHSNWWTWVPQLALLRVWASANTFQGPVRPGRLGRWILSWPRLRGHFLLTARTLLVPGLSVPVWELATVLWPSDLSWTTPPVFLVFQFTKGQGMGLLVSLTLWASSYSKSICLSL